jgi:iron complex outermembrane receptor protein
MAVFAVAAQGEERVMEESVMEQRVMEEIIVFAQKREQPLLDVPISISTLSGEEMEAAGVYSIDDISRLVPNLEVQTNVNTVQSTFRIRRVGNLGNIPTFEPAVGVFMDGAFRSRSVFATSELFDLERVEVLRGPQNTLYGKNTSAGVIGIYTRAPGETLEGSAELSAGNVEGGQNALAVNLKGGLSGPLTDTLAGSIGGAVTRQDYIIKSAVTGGGAESDEIDRYSLRGQLQWEATDRLKLRLIAATVQEHDDRASEDLFYDPAGYVSNFVLPTFQMAGISGICNDNDPHNRKTCLRLARTTDLETHEATLLVDYALNNGLTLASLTSWDYYKLKSTYDDITQVMAPLLRVHDSEKGNSFQQELRLTSAGGETIDWLLGAFYFTNTYKRGDEGDSPVFLFDTLSDDPTVAAVNQARFGTPFPLPFATQGQFGFLDAQQDTDYYAIYGHATWSINDQFSLTGGLRWQHENKDGKLVQYTNDPSPSIISLLLSPASVGGVLDRSTNKWTWSVSPQWFVSDATMLFATVTRGFKSGGFNVGFGRMALDNREFDDENSTNYEIGVKADLREDRLWVAAAAFFTEYHNYQDAAFVGAQFSVGNARKVELKGFELEGTALLTDKLDLNFNVSYADLTYKDNPAGVCYPGRVPDSPTVPGACVLDGEHPINAPLWKTYLGLAYTQPVDWGDVYGRVDWSWTDDYNTSFTADPRLIQNSYNWVNLRAGTRWGKFELVFWVKNLTDAKVVNLDAVLSLYAGDGSYMSYLQEPRSYGITFRARW